MRLLAALAVSAARTATALRTRACRAGGADIDVGLTSIGGLMRLSTVACAVALLAIGCAGRPATPAVDARAEEQAIRALDDQWNAAIAKKDVEACVSFYATDGIAMWPAAPAAKGADAIRAAWTEMFKAPNLKLVLTPEEIRIAQAGDIAIDVGKAQADMDTPQGGHVMETAKYVVVWKKMNGAWKAQYDIFNANSPPPPPTAPK